MFNNSYKAVFWFIFCYKTIKIYSRTLKFLFSMIIHNNNILFLSSTKLIESLHLKLK